MVAELVEVVVCVATGNDPLLTLLVTLLFEFPEEVIVVPVVIIGEFPIVVLFIEVTISTSSTLAALIKISSGPL